MNNIVSVLMSTRNNVFLYLTSKVCAVLQKASEYLNRSQNSICVFEINVLKDTYLKNVPFYWKTVQFSSGSSKLTLVAPI